MPGGLTLLASAAVDIPTPPASKVTIFFNTDTNLPSYKDSSGIVHGLVGDQGFTGPAGPQGEEGDEPDQVIAIPGPQGNPGPTGAQGPVGPMFVPEDGVDGEDGLLQQIVNQIADWDKTIVKQANEQVVNSNAYIEDAELFTTLVAGGVYLVEAFIILSCDSTSADYKWEWRLGAVLTNVNQWDGYWIANGTGPTNETANNVSPNAFWGNLVIQTQATHVPLVMSHRFTVIVPPTTSSDFQLHYRFAQNAAGGAGTEAITYAGSMMRWKRLA